MAVETENETKVEVTHGSPLVWSLSPPVPGMSQGSKGLDPEAVTRRVGVKYKTTLSSPVGDPRLGSTLGWRLMGCVQGAG